MLHGNVTRNNTKVRISEVYNHSWNIIQQSEFDSLFLNCAMLLSLLLQFK